PRAIADRDFNDLKACHCAFQDHLHGPAVCRFLKTKFMNYICPTTAKWAEVRKMHTVEQSDQTGSQPIAKLLVPGHRPHSPAPAETGTYCDFGMALKNGRQ